MAMTSSFRKTTYTRKTTTDVKFILELLKTLLKFFSETLSRKLIYNALQKEQWPVPIVEQREINLL